MKPFVTASVLMCALSGHAFAQMPAARLGDGTSHPGGQIVTGSPDVLIDGRPAARVFDQVLCPVVDPPVDPFSPPRPHVGGPIVTGSTTVFINGRPAARVGSTVNEVPPAPQSTVVPAGAFTVLIGG
jgi:uncharacterized Zn-binding protein involved in type VI secretion